MAIRKILKEENEDLNKKSEEIKSFDNYLKTILDDLKDTLGCFENGIGLAAPQIGIRKRVILINLNGFQVEMINPKIIERSEEKTEEKEGCLSVLEEYLIERHNEIKVEFFNRNNEKLELKCSGLISRCIQHEIDHLNGVLISKKKFEIERKNKYYTEITRIFCPPTFEKIKHLIEENHFSDEDMERASKKDNSYYYYFVGTKREIICLFFEENKIGLIVNGESIDLKGNYFCPSDESDEINASEENWDTLVKIVIKKYLS